jgi:hypothetical protein
MSLRRKVETAFLQVIANAGPPTAGLNRYSSQESQLTERATPYVLCQVLSDIEDPPRLGNHSLDVLLTVATNADRQSADDPDPAVLHAANLDAVREALFVPDLAAQLSAVHEAFTVQGLIRKGGQPVHPGERLFADAFTWYVYACEAELS